MKNLFLLAVFSIAMSGCMSDTTGDVPGVSRQVPVDSDFVDGSLIWSAHLGRYDYRWGIRVLDGYFEVCGVGSHASSYSRSQSNAVMRKASIEFEGRKILEDLSFFADAGYSADLKAHPANCKRTNTVAPDRAWEVFLATPGGRARF